MPLNLNISEMATSSSFVLHCLVFAVCLLSVFADEDRKLYIVYMGSLPTDEYSPSSHHLNLLQEVVETSSVESLLVKSYKRSFNGFAAMLSDYEAQNLAKNMGVVSLFPSRTYQLQTTNSWNFLGFNDTTDKTPEAESDIVVGVIDSGIWPESASFNDEGLSPPPKKWKGICKGGSNFTCNNKIIGARDYLGTSSARDDNGHGTHTASTAAGNKVKDASFFGVANGTARGGVPSARIAAYKVCNSDRCGGSDILAAFDDAIADGVDIITISLGSDSSGDYFNDVIAIGAFHAVEKGILTSHSAGNSGPKAGSVSSVAPWLLSVAASTTDRNIIDKVVLGNQKILAGKSINSFSLGKDFPLINGIDARSAFCSASSARSCSQGCLRNKLVQGKIVVCDNDNFRVINEVMRAGAAGAITASGSVEDISILVPLPALLLKADSFAVVESYMMSSKNPVANILKSEAIKDPTAPVVAYFSSRGPNLIVPDLLKPDISAPGVDILAAYPPNVPPARNPTDKRQGPFGILSGTSMSCPHAAGVAAYVKTFHPDWSPSAIKSAIMTTASPMNGTRDSEFAYGSGHVNPLKAVNPGLVYDAEKADYINFLCSLDGYTDSQVRLISGDNNATCPRDAKRKPYELNYPSISSGVQPNQQIRIVFPRRVTNVGIAKSTYKAQVFTTSKVEITVEPEVLAFESVNEAKSFNVTVQSGRLRADEIVSASLVWSDGSHTVRSPIVIHTL